jgi:regulator of protease activity HflC (stomatin/prohibitin superfamily)
MMDNLPVSGDLALAAALAVFALILVTMGVVVVPEGNARLVERLGRRHKVIYPGVNLIIPFIDSVRKNLQTKLYTYNKDGDGIRRVELGQASGDISLAEHRMDPLHHTMQSKDNSELKVDVVAYFKIKDPAAAVYDVSAVGDALNSMLETTLRQEVGKLDSDAIITSRRQLSDQLKLAIQEASFSWGIDVLRVEVEEIRYANDQVQRQLSEARNEELRRRAEVVAAQALRDKEVLAAEGEKRSAILKAEGDQQAAVLRAEGDKRAVILAAEGEFEAKRLEAEALFLLASREQEGKAQGYAAMSAALRSAPESLIALEALRAQVGVADSLGKSQNTMILPTEVAGLFGAIGALSKGLGEFRKIAANGTMDGAPDVTPR